MNRLFPARWLVYLLLLIAVLTGCSINQNDLNDPDIDIAPQLREAESLISSQQFTAALEVLTVASQRNNRDPRLYNAQGSIYLKQHQWDFAENASQARERNRKDESSVGERRERPGSRHQR